MSTALRTTYCDDYIASLPRGLDSHPECTSKGSLFRACVAARSLESSPKFPPRVRELIATPPLVSSWIPEVDFSCLVLLLRENCFADDDAFLHWSRKFNAELFRGPLYRILFYVGSMPLLAHGSDRKWRQFHRGSSLQTIVKTPTQIAATFAFPTNLFSPLHIRMFGVALEAAGEVIGGRWRTSAVQFEPERASIIIDRLEKP